MITTKRRTNSQPSDSKVIIEEPKNTSMVDIDYDNEIYIEDNPYENKYENNLDISRNDIMGNENDSYNSYKIMHQIQKHNLNDRYHQRKNFTEDNNKMKIFLSIYVVAVIILTAIVIATGIAIYNGSKNEAINLPFIKNNYSQKAIVKNNDLYINTILNDLK